MKLIMAAFLMFAGIVCLLGSLSYAYADKNNNGDVLFDYTLAIALLVVTFGSWFLMLVGVAR